jgi:hypothetical protein
MRALVFGSKEWSDYNDLIRQVTLLIEDNKHYYPEDKEFIFIHKGNIGAENMITEYIGKVEKLIKQKGYKIKEQIIRDKSSFSDVSMIESEPTIALVFGECARNKQVISLLETYGVPYRYFKE